MAFIFTSTTICIAIIIVFFVSLCLIFLKINSKIVTNKKNYFILVLFLVLFFNFKNFNRINNEFKEKMCINLLIFLFLLKKEF